MYSAVIQIHQYLSWIVIVTALFALYRSWRGVIFKKYWNSADRTAGMLLTVFADLQLVAGIVLYAFLSPLTRHVFSGFMTAIQDPAVKFYVVGHTGIMVLAIILIHTGRSKSRKAQFAARKHRISAIYYTLAAALILFRIPWDRIFVQ